MSGSHERRENARPFIVVPYVPNEQGELLPEMPALGWCASRDGAACKLFVDHRRPRRTGPCFPLTVVRCRRHQCAFTLYPPAYAPYARTPVAAVAPDGESVRGDASCGAQRFGGTLFDAALDAAAGQPWPREHIGPLQKWWRTQLRRLALATYLVGVAPELSTRRREQMAELLAVDVLMLHEQARGLRRDAGYRERGQAVRRVLAALPRSRFLPERLLECGHVARWWGPAYRWLPREGVLRRQPFRSAPTSTRPARPP